MCLEKICRKYCEMHKSPINFALHLIAGIILAYSLWVHSIKLILVAVLIAIIGHLIQITNKKSKKKKR
jgi:hypothetical protein